MSQVNENEVDYSEFDLDFTGAQEPTVDQNLEATSEQKDEVSQSEQPNQSSGQEGETTGQKEGEEVQTSHIEGAQESSEESKEETPEDDIESLRKQLAEAQGELLALKNWKPTNEKKEETSEGKQKEGEQKPVPDTQTKKETNAITDFPQAANQVSNVDFLQGQDYSTILEDGEKFNHLLNVVATVAINTAIAAAQERILRQIPEVVETSARQQFRIKELVGDFYTANKDLEPYKPAVSMAAMKIYNDNPQMDIAEILSKAAEETRKFLRLRPAASTRPRTPARPAGNQGGGVRPSAPNLTDQEQQILDLLS